MLSSSVKTRQRVGGCNVRLWRELPSKISGGGNGCRSSYLLLVLVIEKHTFIFNIKQQNNTLIFLSKLIWLLLYYCMRTIWTGPLTLVIIAGLNRDYTRLSDQHTPPFVKHLHLVRYSIYPKNCFAFVYLCRNNFIGLWAGPLVWHQPSGAFRA